MTVTVIELEARWRCQQVGELFQARVGGAYQGRPSATLWIAQPLVQTKEEKQFGHTETVHYVPLPASARLIHQNDLWIVRPGDSYVFEFTARCGYRGDSSFDVLAPEPRAIIPIEYYHSPAGRLGVDQGAVIEVSKFPVYVCWQRTGRLRGLPARGMSVVTLRDGQLAIQEFANVQSLAELDALRELLTQEA